MALPIWKKDNKIKIRKIKQGKASMRMYVSFPWLTLPGSGSPYKMLSCKSHSFTYVLPNLRSLIKCHAQFQFQKLPQSSTNHSNPIGSISSRWAVLAENYMYLTSSVATQPQWQYHSDQSTSELLQSVPNELSKPNQSLNCNIPISNLKLWANLTLTNFFFWWTISIPEVTYCKAMLVLSPLR